MSKKNYANDTLETICERRSIRAYKPDAVSDYVLTSILEAGQNAPYVTADSRLFTVLQDRTVIGRLNQSAIAEGIKLGDFQRKMFSAPGFDGTYGAPAVIIVSGNESTVQYEAVCAASVQNILIAAASLGVGSCWAYFPVFAFHGDERNQWMAELRIPDGYKPCASVLLGYSSEITEGGTDERYKNEITFL